MVDGVISLDDIQSSGNDGGSTESDELAELRGAVDRINGDVHNAVERAESDDGTDAESLTEFAEALANDDDLWETMESYRMMNDQHRIKQNYLLNADKEFTDWSAQFYGDTDDPEVGTYNHVQQAARDMDGNLYYYKALFPSPDAEHWPSEQAVVWQERPDEDSHIYVTENFVEAYGDFTLEIDGQDRPVPPWNSASESDSANDGGSSDDGDAIDPRDFTNAEIEELVGDLTREQLDALLEVEKATKSRKGAKNAIRDEIDAREASSDDDESDDSDGADELAEVLRENGIGSVDELTAALE